ncbi:MAG TPA: decaprenyl-phosphate phosphoribosyltransferase [Nitrolancea sp.]|nr:decaprenyl-phosphate phosphoribosyltransferase [Nitrolancea sp.]
MVGLETDAIQRRTMSGSVRALIETMRPKQWTKNAVVYAPLVFDNKLFDLHDLALVTIAAILFCVTSGSIYLWNDLLDAEADRAHPVKCKRPIASGRLSRQVAMVAAISFALVVLIVSLVITPWLTLVLAGYMVMMFSYTAVLKHLVIVDVFVIAAGFVLRTAAGAVAIDVPLSPWLYVCLVLLALFMGFAKRRNELELLDESAAIHRRNLADYSNGYLDELITIVSAATVMAYSLYTFSAPNLPDSHAMMLTIPFVLYGLFRYLYLVHREGGGGAPEQMLLDDRPLLATVVLWGITAITILYLSNH